MRISLGQKLVVGFLPVVVTVATLGGITYRELDRLHGLADTQDRLTDRSQQVLLLSLQVKELQGLAVHYLGANEPEYQQRFGETKKAAVAAFDALASTGSGDAEANLWAQAGQSLNHLIYTAEATLSGMPGMIHGDAHSEMDTLDEAGAHVESGMEQLRHLSERNRAGAQAEVEALEHRMKYMLTAATLLVAVIGGVVVLLMARRVSRPLQAFVRSAQRVAQGDLRVEPLAAASGDEVGDMAVAFNQMVAHLRDLVGQVAASVTVVASSAEQLNGAITLVSGTVVEVEVDMRQVGEGTAQHRRATEQANDAVDQLKLGIDQIAAAADQQAAGALGLQQVVQHMVSAVRDVADRAHMVATAARDATTAADDGARVVQDTMASMEQARTAVVDASQRIGALTHRSHEIGAITEAITEIAEQTNLLALNAAIEAARAGEHGKGFAVVAGEVRRLAERAGRSSREIAALVETIQSDTTEVAQAMNRSSAAVLMGAGQAEAASQALRTIQELVQRTAGDVQVISVAAERLGTTAAEVSASVELTLSTAQRNRNATEQMAVDAMAVTQVTQAIALTSAGSQGAADSASSAVRALARSAQEILAAVQGLNHTAKDLQVQTERFSM